MFEVLYYTNYTYSLKEYLILSTWCFININRFIQTLLN